MREDSETPYLLQGGEEGASRLRVLAEALRPTTGELLRRAGIRDGMHVLDAGCGNGEVCRDLAGMVGTSGRVTGIDSDPTVLAIAEMQSEGFPNLRYQCREATTFGFASEFDAVYSRFLLTHLRRPHDAVRLMCEALRPGGNLILEDMDFRGHYCYPDCPAFERYVALYQAAADRKGVDANIGVKLFQLLRSCGVEVLDQRTITPVFHSGPGKQIAHATLSQIRRNLVTHQLAADEEIDQLLSELAAFEADSDSLMSLARITQIVGKVPGARRSARSP